MNIFRFCRLPSFDWRQRSNAMRIAVVGAGPAGLVTLFTIRNRLIDKIPGLEVIAYERGNDIGGEWILSDNNPEKYEEGLPMSSSMYRGLQTNIPYPMTQIHPDFPWPEGSPMFPYREDYLKYLRDFATTYNLRRYVEFSKVVTNVRQSDDAGITIVEVKDLATGLTTAERFNYVFLCTGQHRKPFIPPEHDTSKFTGLVFHYHDLRDPERLRGKRVVLIGSSFGALDLTIMLAKNVEKLYLSWYQNKPFWHPSVQNYAELKSKFARAVGDEVTFEDGSTVKADVILYATGFRQVHPLSPKLELDFNTNPCLFPIYKHVVHPQCPSIFFIGKAYTFVIFSARLHAEFACAIVDGRFTLPKKDEMLTDIERFQSKWAPKLKNMYEGDVTKYFAVFEIEAEKGNDLAQLAQCPPMPPFTKPLLYDTFRVVRDDALNYRRYSLVTDYKTNPRDGIFYIPPQ